MVDRRSLLMEAALRCDRASALLAAAAALPELLEAAEALPEQVEPPRRVPRQPMAAGLLIGGLSGRRGA